jgi:hypothetical protein
MGTEVPAVVPVTTWKDIPKRAPKVALVGFASSSKHLAPYTDHSWEIWGMNELYKQVPRWDRLFEIHTLEHLRSESSREGQGEPHLTWLRKQPGPGDPLFCPVYMQKHFDDIPASVELPVAELAAMGIPGDPPYFTSTPAYMIAMAIAMGYEEIGLWGIDLLESQEYQYQRPCAEFWCGYAIGKGIKITIASTSALCKANYLYGFTYPPIPGEYAPLVAFYQEQLKAVNEANAAQKLGAENTAAIIRTIRTLKKKRVEGLTLEQLDATLDTNEKQMLAQHGKLVAGYYRSAGNIEALTSVITWAEHHERGGALIAKPITGVAPIATSEPVAAQAATTQPEVTTPEVLSIEALG